MSSVPIARPVATMGPVASPRRLRQLGGWLAYGLLLAVAPLLFESRVALTVLSQIGYVIIICLSYNMLLGQGGMLSFGHAVYTGAGSFAAVHLMNAAAGSATPFPLVAVPLVAGLGGLAMALLFGWVTTKKSGTTFAMITLGIGELVAVGAAMFPAVFGGESGIATDRSYGHFFGWSFGPQIQAYYLIACYCFACTLLMYAFTRTPLGLLLNAVRDNTERVEFIGYDSRSIRFLAFVVAGFFAGIGGGLAAINFEMVNAADSLGSARSGSVLIFTFLGGIGFFYGPIIGAVLLVLTSVLLSEVSQAWLLYLGLAFLLMVMFAPGGLASLLATQRRLARHGQLSRLLPWYAVALLASAALLGGTVIAAEMIYHLRLNAAMNPDFRLFGWTLDTGSTTPWLVAGVLAVAGLAGILGCRGRLAEALQRAEQSIRGEATR
jgi:branched-chain amino acid transport system permease protein